MKINKTGKWALVGFAALILGWTMKNSIFNDLEHTGADDIIGIMLMVIGGFLIMVMLVLAILQDFDVR